MIYFQVESFKQLMAYLLCSDFYQCILRIISEIPTSNLQHFFISIFPFPLAILEQNILFINRFCLPFYRYRYSGKRVSNENVFSEHFKHDA
jgi:hypothetical protein